MAALSATSVPLGTSPSSPSSRPTLGL